MMHWHEVSKEEEPTTAGCDCNSEPLHAGVIQCIVPTSVRSIHLDFQSLVALPAVRSLYEPASIIPIASRLAEACDICPEGK